MDKKVIPTKLSSILKCKCPTCRTGNVFTDPATSWNNYNKMNEYCPVCGLRFELEIGFFWGAMYVGYGFNVALSVNLGIAVYVFGHNPDVWVYMSAIILGIILTYRFNFRYARILLLHMFAPKFDITFIENSNSAINKQDASK